MSAISAVLFGAAGVALLLALAWALWTIGRALWGAPEEGDAVWGSALAPELPQPPQPLSSSPVEVIRIAPSAVVHVGASEDAPAVGSLGTLAERPSDDLLTFAEQVRSEPGEWAWFETMMIDYENALLTRVSWVPLGDVRTMTVVESTQQRIDRWLREGGDGVRAARAEVRMAASETWDAPSGALPVLDSYVADRVAEALLAS